MQNGFKFRDPVLLLILHSLLLPSFACFHSEEPIDLEDRAQYIMRYSAVAPLLTNGSVSLLWYLDELYFVCLLWLRCLMFTNSDCRQKIFGCDFNFVGCLRELDSREASRKKIHERNFIYFPQFLFSSKFPSTPYYSITIVFFITSENGFFFLWKREDSSILQFFLVTGVKNLCSPDSPFLYNVVPFATILWRERLRAT